MNMLGWIYQIRTQEMENLNNCEIVCLRPEVLIKALYSQPHNNHISADLSNQNKFIAITTIFTIGD
jgi:hypothetical protein